MFKALLNSNAECAPISIPGLARPDPTSSKAATRRKFLEAADAMRAARLHSEIRVGYEGAAAPRPGGHVARAGTIC